MREAEYSGQFKRDVKQAQRRGKDMDKLKTLLGLLIAGVELPGRYEDHPLKGDWRGFRDAISSRIGYYYTKSTETWFGLKEQDAMPIYLMSNIKVN